MKTRFSVAAAAVLVVTALHAGGLRAASSPAGIPFENDASFT
ncbi:conjugal transfer protein TraK, partial [Cronobacter sakazakii]